MSLLKLIINIDGNVRHISVAGKLLCASVKCNAEFISL